MLARTKTSQNRQGRVTHWQVSSPGLGARGCRSALAPTRAPAHREPTQSFKNVDSGSQKGMVQIMCAALS